MHLLTTKSTIAQPVAGDKADPDKTPKIQKLNPIHVMKIDEEKGIVDAIVNVYGIIDLHDDIVHYGTFKKSIKEAFPKGKIRVLDSHNYRSVFDVLGMPIAMREIRAQELPEEVLKEYPDATGGLWTRTQYSMGTQKGRDAFRLIADGFIKEFSVGFYLMDWDYQTDEETGKTIRHIRTGRLVEYSPVIWGANPATSVEDVKRAENEADTNPVDDKPFIVGIDAETAALLEANGDEESKVDTVVVTPEDNENLEDTDDNEDPEQLSEDIANDIDDVNPEQPITLFQNATNENELIEAVARLMAGQHAPTQLEKRQNIALVEKQLASRFNDQQIKSIAHHNIARAVALTFYKNHDDDFWIQSVHSGYLLATRANDDVKDCVYRVEYSLDTDTMSINFVDASQFVSGYLTFAAFDNEDTDVLSEDDSAGQSDTTETPTDIEESASQPDLEARRLSGLERANSIQF